MANGYKVRIGEPTKSANGKRLMPFVMIFREEQEQESIHDLKPCPMGEDLKTKVIDTIDSLIPKGQNSLDLETATMAYGITRAKEAVLNLFNAESTQTNAELTQKSVVPTLDCISRQAAIDEVCKMMYECFGADEEELDAIEVTLHELPSAEPRWIPVTERLPDKMGTYLVTLDYKKHGTGVMSLWFHNEEIGWDLRVADVVTAWMPLPEPWKGEEDG